MVLFSEYYTQYIVCCRLSPLPPKIANPQNPTKQWSFADYFFVIWYILSQIGVY